MWKRFLVLVIVVGFVALAFSPAALAAGLELEPNGLAQWGGLDIEPNG